jgi:hypothetical protein
MTVFYLTTRLRPGPPYTTSVDATATPDPANTPRQHRMINTWLIMNQRKRRSVSCRGHTVDLQNRSVIGRLLRVEATFALP